MLSYDFVAGALTAGYVLAGLFFLRFWRSTRDVLFLSFSLAFFLLALSQVLLTMTPVMMEDRSWLYVIRLLAFLLILLAIVRKNRR